ncbi:MAG: ABC transporter permease [Armatimonadetes bacterium]|nr:ABC transporter permease [Armatimonadota bacterium]
MLHRTLFIIEETLTSLKRDASMQLAAITTAMVSLVLLGLVAFTLFQLDSVASSLPRQFEINAFAKMDAPREEIEAVVGRIEAMPETKSVKLVTKEEAWPEEKRRLGSDMTFEGMPNPLPDKLVVAAKKPELCLTLADKIREEPVIDKVVDLRDDLGMVQGIARIVRWTGLIFTGILMLGALILIYNAIRLTVKAREDEIAVMALVGATHRTIRLPFVLEGAVQGMLGGLLAAIIVLASVPRALDALAEAAPFIGNWAAAAPPLAVAGLLVGAGTIMGALSAFYAAQRFVRV